MQKNKGFTLVELLIVVSIIAILLAIVLAFTSDANSRTKKAAFKKEINSYQNKGILDCTEATNPIIAPVDTKNTDWNDFADNCSNGDSSFIISANSIRIRNCTAVVTESDILYSDECN